VDLILYTCIVAAYCRKKYIDAIYTFSIVVLLAMLIAVLNLPAWSCYLRGGAKKKVVLVLGWMLLSRLS